MASADDAFLSKIACRYFRLGICNKGEACRYSHNISPDQSFLPVLSPAVTQLDCVSQDVEPDEQQLQDGKQTSNFLSDGDGCTPKIADSAPDVATAIPIALSPGLWATAAEFVPGQPWKGLGDVSNWVQPSETYDESCGYAVGGASTSNMPYDYVFYGTEANDSVTYHNVDGSVSSPYATGDIVNGLPELCDMCGQELPPATNEELRNQHLQECIRHHEEEMELSFAVQHSREKVCGICMDVVWEKEPESMARFGLLSNCCHVFCLSCIRRWRAAEQFDKKTIRGCPECRVQSDFVVPSRYWFDDQEGKSKLIAAYKAELGKKHCRYFARGRGKCPFNDKCFYLHMYPDGRIASPLPARRRGDGYRRRREPAHVVLDADSDDTDTDTDSDTDVFLEIQPSTLYEIIEELNERVARLADQLENSILRRLNLPRTGLMYLNQSDDDS